MALHTGQQATLIMCVLAAAFLAVAFGLWIEALWAWGAGCAISAATVVLDMTLLHDGDWIPWLAFLIAFGVTAVQGLRDRARSETRASPIA